MLHDQGLLLHLRTEACNTTVYLQNRSPHQILEMSTLEEAFLGKKLDLAHFGILVHQFIDVLQRIHENS